jgi:hypothetical protein
MTLNLVFFSGAPNSLPRVFASLPRVFAANDAEFSVLLWSPKYRWENFRRNSIKKGVWRENSLSFFLIAANTRGRLCLPRPKKGKKLEDLPVFRVSGRDSYLGCPEIAGESAGFFRPSLYLSALSPFLCYRKKSQPLAESARLNVLERVTVSDTSVASTLSPLPSPLHTTFPRST